ncbi:MAG: VIT domain-containing protein [Acidimicrobiales bacterium]
MTLLPTELPPFGGLRSKQGHLPLVAMDVRAEIAGLLATTTVRQTFRNVLDEHIEATYVFPLPDRAGVTSFVATLGGRRVEGILKERQAARADYDAAIAEGKRAALLEEDRPGAFAAKVGNIAPGEEAEVEVVLTGPLPYDQGEAAFRFPLVVAPRYVPGDPLDGPGAGDGTALDTDLVPDASRITPPVLLPGQPNPVNLSLEVTLDPLGLPVSNLRSTLHAALVRNDDRGPLTVAVRPGERLDRDFILRFALAGAVPTTVAAVTADSDAATEGTYAVTVVPPATTAARRPLDVAVVLDRSGSMAGWKMVAARRAAARIVDTLDAGDRVVVLGFDDQIAHPERLGRTLVPASDQSRFAAVEFLAKLEARGGTEIHRAVDEAAAALSDPHRDAVLVLVTDGQIAQEDHVLRSAARWLDRVRVFTVGIDRAVNAGFLQRLADAGRGRCELVESEDALDEAMTRIHRAVATPVVQGLTVRAENGAELVTGTATPDRAPDCFPGAPVVLSGRYSGHPTAFIVSGTVPDGAAWTQTVEALPVANRAVRTSWARAHVRILEDRYLVQPGDSLAKEVVEASLAHGVLSRFTAFVAVDHSDTSGSTTPHPVMQPAELPSGWAGGSMTMAGATGMPMAMAAPLPMMAESAMPAPPQARIFKGTSPAGPTWKELAQRLRDLLDALVSGQQDPAALAAELDGLLPDLDRAGAPKKVRRAVRDLVAALRSASVDIEAKADALRQAVDANSDRKAGRFWL